MSGSNQRKPAPQTHAAKRAVGYTPHSGFLARIRSAIDGTMLPVRRSGGRDDSRQHARDDIVGRAAFHLELRRERHAMAQHGGGARLHVVGNDIVAALQDGGRASGALKSDAGPWRRPEDECRILARGA